MKWRSLQESDAGSDLRSLREIFAERKELIAKYVPADVQAVHLRTLAGLKAQGLAANALGVAAQIAAAGASIVAVSPQTEKQAFFMHDQHKLAFPLLVDAHNQLARQFGLVYRVPEEQQALYSRAFVNLPFANGDSSWELPIPATFVVDLDGTILSALANEDYSDRPEPIEILSVVRRGC